MAKTASRELTIAPREWLVANVHVIVFLELRTRVAEVLTLCDIAMNRADDDTRKADVQTDLLPFLGGCFQFFERAMTVLANQSRCDLQAL